MATKAQRQRRRRLEDHLDELMLAYELLLEITRRPGHGERRDRKYRPRSRSTVV